MMVKIKGLDKHREEMGDEELKNTLLHIERSRILGVRCCNISLYDLAGIIQEIMECRGNQPKYEKTIADMAEWIEGTAEGRIIILVIDRRIRDLNNKIGG